MSTHGDFIGHEPCPSEKCSSSDGFARYADGYGKCFVCDYYEFGDTEGESKVKSEKKKGAAPPPVEGDFKALRGVSQRTMETMKYVVGNYGGERAHLVAVPFADGKGHAATKIRLPGKEFRFVGDTASSGLIFQDRWPAGGKKLVITEGEFDALSVAEAQGCKWPVVSLPNGCQSVKKVFGNCFKYINSFDEIVLWFDNDEPGRAAAEEAALLCDVGKVRIAKTPQGYKDANDLLKAGREKDIISAVWQAEPYTPARFISFGDLKEEVLRPVERGKPWIFPELNEWTYGRRPGETYFFGAGTGVGKTDFFTQQAAADVKAGEKVALFSFEQTPAETAKRMAGKFAGRRFHVPDAGWTQAELEVAFDELSQHGCYVYNHWGSADWSTVSDDITALAHLGYKHFYIDHLTAFAAHAEDERKMLEETCAEMAGLAQRLGANFYVISHLATPDGTPHEEGGRVFIRHFKGSRAIGYWAHFMFGIERDTQAVDEETKLRAKFRVLKDRYTGQATGKVLTMCYDPDTGLQHVDNDWEWPEVKRRAKTAADHGFKTDNDDF